MFVAYVWQTTGFSMVLFLAGLRNVSPNVIETARLDGANRARCFRHVTRPALGSTIAVVIVPSLINSLRTFDIVYGMTRGGPSRSMQLLAFWEAACCVRLPAKPWQAVRVRRADRPGPPDHDPELLGTFSAETA